MLLQRRRVASLSHHSARGVAWTLSGQWGSQVVRLLGIVVLARLLTPDDYGLVAMVWAITGFVATVGGLGLSEAVVQKEHVSHAQASTLFWVNVAVGALLTGLVAAASPLLAGFYDRPELVGITLALSATFLLGGLTVQHQALMLRQLDFRSVAFRTFLATVVNVVVSIGVALAGGGYWALVAGSLAQAAATVVFMWRAVPWRPGRPVRGSGTRSMLSFGGGISTFSLLNYASRNVDDIVIGRFLGADQLGLYSRAYGLLMLPLTQIHGPVSNVVRPSLASLWPEPERYRRYFLSALSGLAYLVMPLVVVLAVLAGPAVEVLLGPRWLPAAEVFRWLAVAGLLQTVGYTNGWLYATSGRAWAMARWALISRPIVIASFFAGLPWGITGVAIAYAASQLVLTPLGIARAGRGTPVSLRDVLAVSVQPAVVSALAGVVAAAVVVALGDASAVLRLSVPGAAAVVAATGLVLLWPTCRRQVTFLARTLRKQPTDA
ncbi:lipopolysaccharide biosynthesis protein [uncultured Pseudokineococcus sp.]|uniref:lipopolysaccharide biosynthesis protein n=1 Tax=uncultured Pseudokineococcus sp. TaxID=1642928 RepID=UPI00263A3843|nr:lipopolysaccharide biosynthesis protein [uncultured Pseudokineococcus sp.]